MSKKTKMRLIIIATLLIGAFIWRMTANEEDLASIEPPTKVVEEKTPESLKEHLEIQEKVVDLVAEENKGNGFFVDVLTKNDQSGYIISAQLLTDDETKAEELAKNTMQDIKDLDYEKVKEIQVTVIKDSKIVHEEFYP